MIIILLHSKRLVKVKKASSPLEIGSRDFTVKIINGPQESLIGQFGTENIALAPSSDFCGSVSCE